MTTRGPGRPEDDPLYAAEEAMVEHELEIFTRVFASIASHLDRDREYTQEEFDAAVRAAMEADPELHEYLARLATFTQFRKEQ